MTNNNHPITPPPELKQQWFNEAPHQGYCSATGYVIDKASQWGYEQRGAANEAELQKARDQELEACCKALDDIWDQEDVVTLNDFLRGLRSARRPKPPIPAEKALADFDGLMDELDGAGNYSYCAERIRSALKRLQELEGQADG